MDLKLLNWKLIWQQDALQKWKIVFPNYDKLKFSNESSIISQIWPFPRKLSTCEQILYANASDLIPPTKFNSIRIKEKDCHFWDRKDKI
jgi:hypothetical protein